MPSKPWKLDFKEHVLYHGKKSALRGAFWNISSGTICSIYILMSKFVGKAINTSHVHNEETFHEAVGNRKGRGLLTVCNHSSRLDDPLLFHIVKWRHVFNVQKFRYSTGAEDVCFKVPFHAFCMAVGKVLPLTRGAGVYQPPMNHCVDQLSAGKWIHIFPEGKINVEDKPIRLKWGVGRLISEPAITPLVLLIHHIGFDSIFPNDKTNYPRVGKTTSVYVGDALDFSKEVAMLKSLKKTEEEIRKHLTDIIQEKMAILKKEAEKFHKKHVKDKVIGPS